MGEEIGRNGLARRSRLMKERLPPRIGDSSKWTVFDNCCDYASMFWRKVTQEDLYGASLIRTPWVMVGRINSKNHDDLTGTSSGDCANPGGGSSSSSSSSSNGSSSLSSGSGSSGLGSSAVPQITPASRGGAQPL